MSVETLPGSFASFFSNDVQRQAVIVDEPTATGPNYTLGAVRVSDVGSEPSAPFTILGWTLRAEVMLYATARDTWGRLGDLYFGLAKDAGLSDSGGGTNFLPGTGATFPQDLSAFSRVFNGAEDNVQLIDNTLWNAVNAGTIKPTIVAATFMLPVPLSALPGTRLQAALVKTAGLYGSGSMYFTVLSANYSVLYQLT